MSVHACCLLLACALWASALGQRVSPKEMDPDVYCKSRTDQEFFRKKMSDDISEKAARLKCSYYYRCVPGGGNRKLVSRSYCGSSMYFDVEKQICQVRSKVDNCAQFEKEQKPKPVWPLPIDAVSKCPYGEIECGSGECLARELFCDAVPHCEDGSDENICNDPELDPNSAAKCDIRECKWEEGCFCSPDGTRIPGDRKVSETPQMITISFSGAVTEEGMKIYREIFRSSFKNKVNDCTIKGTFFVSHAFTNYSAVQELHRLGHEIAVSSITNNPNTKYWSTMLTEDYAEEFDGARLIAERYGNLSQGEILGMRVPSGRVGGNQQFQMMVDFGFLYDSSMAAPKADVPLWPYTLQHRMPHKCLGTDQFCPTKNFSVWEMVINSLDRRDDGKFSEDLTGCHFVDQCSNLVEPKQFRAFLELNLQRHYTTNRAPLGLHFTSSYFLTRKSFLREFTKWIADVSQRGDFFFVNMIQAINWMEQPVELTALKDFPEWKAKCDPKGLPYCSLPSPCESVPPRELAGENSMYLHTCSDCPRKYPWLYDPYGEGPDGRYIL